MSGETNQTTQRTFEKLAASGSWPSKYGEKNHVNYNFITRRESVFALVQDEQFSSVLDVGCGTGDYFEVLSKISERYTGVDFSAPMIAHAQEKYGTHSKKPVFKVGSGEQLPFGDSTFDCVCAIGFIQYFDDPDVPLKEMKRVLKPGGILIIQSYQVDLFKRIAILFGLEKMKALLLPLARYVLKRKRGGFAADRPYTKQALDSLVERQGFSIEAHHFNNYHVLPKTLRRFFAKAYIAMSEKIESHRSPTYEPFAVNYVGRYRLTKKP